jgi:divalent metal cation (Fe/Co/Zn/Cd) transporter
VSLPHEDVQWIADFVAEGWPQVRSFHHLQTRKAGPQRFIDFHVVVDDGMSVAGAHALADEIVVAIKGRVPESRVHIHVEPCDYGCKPSCATGCSVEPDVRQERRDERRSMQPAGDP